jgi:putative FmdB family regulatory protein
VPIYDYKCKNCLDTFDVTKRIAQADEIETCPHCQASCDKHCRYISKAKDFYGEKPDEAFFSNALGKWVKSKKDQARQAKDRGWIEVGNDDVNASHARADREREKKSSDRWNEYIKPGPYHIRGA